MTFEDACKICYELFKKEYNSGIGMIYEYTDCWVFYRKVDKTDYGALPVIVYKNTNHSLPLTFDMYMRCAEKWDNGKIVDVPELFTVL